MMRYQGYQGISSEKGSAIIISLLLVFIFGIMGVALLVTANLQSKMVTNQVDSNEALDLSKIGVMYMKNVIYYNEQVLDQNEDGRINTKDGRYYHPRLRVVMRPAADQYGHGSPERLVVQEASESIEPDDVTIGLIDAIIEPARYDNNVTVNVWIANAPRPQYEFRVTLFENGRQLGQTKVEDDMLHMGEERILTMPDLYRVGRRVITMDVELIFHQDPLSSIPQVRLKMGNVSPISGQDQSLDIPDHWDMDDLQYDGTQWKQKIRGIDITQYCIDEEQWKMKNVNPDEHNYLQVAFDQDVYNIFATGFVNTASRTLQVRVYKENFLRWARFAQGDFWVGDLVEIPGMMYVGGTLNYGRDVVFWDEVRVREQMVPSRADATNKYQAKGKILVGVDKIDLPQGRSWERALQLAEENGWIINPGGVAAEIDLNYFDYADNYLYGGYVVYKDPFGTPHNLGRHFNGVVYIKGDVKVKGHLHGGRGVTIYSTGNIYITSHITCGRGWSADVYLPVANQVKLVETGDDGELLGHPVNVGLAAWHDVIIDEEAPKTLFVNAVIFAGGDPDTQNQGSLRAIDRSWPDDGYDNPPYAYTDFPPAAYNLRNPTVDMYEEIAKDMINTYYPVLPDFLWYDRNDNGRKDRYDSMDPNSDVYGIKIDLDKNGRYNLVEDAILWPMWIPNDNERENTFQDYYGDPLDPTALQPGTTIINRQYINDIVTADPTATHHFVPIAVLDINNNGVIEPGPAPIQRDNDAFYIEDLKDIMRIWMNAPSWNNPTPPDANYTYSRYLKKNWLWNDHKINEWRITPHFSSLIFEGPIIEANSTEDGVGYWASAQEEESLDVTTRNYPNGYDWEGPSRSAFGANFFNVTCWDWISPPGQNPPAMPGMGNDWEWLDNGSNFTHNLSSCPDCVAERNDCWLMHPNFHLLNRIYTYNPSVGEFPPPHFPVPLKGLKEVSVREIDYGRELLNTIGNVPTPTPSY